MSKLNLEVVFGSQDQLSPILKNIVNGSKATASAVKETRNELKKLEQQQKTVAQFRDLKKAINENEQSLQDYKNTLESLSQTDYSQLTKEQAKQYKEAEKNIEQLNKKLKSQKETVIELAQELGGYNIDVMNIADEESKLKGQIHLTTMELDKKQKALERIKAAQSSYHKTQALLTKGKEFAQKGMIAAGAGAALMVVPVKLAIDNESSFADVRKVLNDLPDETLKAINNDLIKLSTQIPISADGFNQLAAAAGQAGFAKTRNDIKVFTTDAAKMGIAFDISAEEAGQAMAELRTQFGLTQDGVRLLGDKINYLSNNSPATAKKILNVVQRVGSLGKAAGYAEGAVAALGGTLVGMGTQEEVAATATKNLMLALVAGNSATKEQKAAFKKLGLDANQVAKDIQKDAVGTTVKFLEAVSNLNKVDQIPTFMTFIGKDVGPNLMPFLNNLDAVRNNLKAVSDANKEAFQDSMENEYAARAATTANNIQLLKNQAVALGIIIGNTLIPPVNLTLQKISEIAKKVLAWTQANPQLTATITKVAAGTVILVGGVSALSLVLLTVIGPLAYLKMAFTALGGVTGVLATAIKFIISPFKLLASTIMFVGKAFFVAGRFMLANPMVLAVTLLATAAFLIYKNWEPIKTFFIDLWSKAKEAFNTGVNFIKGIIMSVDSVFANNPILNLLLPIIGIPRMIIANWSSISAFFSDIWSAVSAVVGAAVAFVWTKITTVFNAVSTFISNVWNGIKNIVSLAWQGLCFIFLNYTPLGYIVSNFDKIMAFLKGLASKFLEIGSNIINGLINGIKSGFDKLKSVWEKINSYMPDFMRKKMQIHSPSRLMKKFGGYIMDGLIIGIDNGIGTLKTTYNKAMDVISQSPVMQQVQAMPVVQHTKNKFGQVVEHLKNHAPEYYDVVQNRSQKWFGMQLPNWVDLQAKMPTMGKTIVDNAKAWLKNLPQNAVDYVKSLTQPAYAIPDTAPALAKIQTNTAPQTANTRKNIILEGDTVSINISQVAGESIQNLTQQIEQVLQRHAQQKAAAWRSRFFDED